MGDVDGTTAVLAALGLGFAVLSLAAAARGRRYAQYLWLGAGVACLTLAVVNALRGR